ncbi:MAG: NTP transferase domain-containing protein [Candidatus Cloacimonetes bacterium]|nr:NTP transferase domain-containing protein [Candidatus Cloacimonadota bacterium]
MKSSILSFKQIYAIIPAAGKGERYGEPKVDASIGDKTFIKQILDTLSQTPIAGVKIVRDVETVDMLDSIKLGIKLAHNDGWNALGWLIWPVDHPLISKKTVMTLLTTFYRNPDKIVNPLYNEQRGHPIVIPVDLIIPDSNLSGGLRQVIADSAFERIDVEVPDSAVIQNINHYEDILQDV